VGVINYLDLDARFWAQMINLGIANSRVEAWLCAYSGRPSLEVTAVVAFAVITLPSLVRFLLRAGILQIFVESSKNMWAC
jgi:hypothetical protein